MWAHYASNHTGFCVKYRLPSKIVRNENKSTLVNTRIGNVNYQPSMKFADSFSVFDALYAKHKIWAYENEVRLVEYDPNNNDNFKTIKIDEDCIQSIYLGLRCSDENREKMKLLLRSRNVKLYQMEVDAIDCYKLVKRIHVNP